MAVRIVAAKLIGVGPSKLEVRFQDRNELLDGKYLKQLEVMGELHHSQVDFNKLSTNAKNTTQSANIFVIIY